MSVSERILLFLSPFLTLFLSRGTRIDLRRLAYKARRRHKNLEEKMVFYSGRKLKLWKGKKFDVDR